MRTQTMKNKWKASYLSTNKSFQFSWQLGDIPVLQSICSEIDKNKEKNGKFTYKTVLVWAVSIGINNMPANRLN